MTHSDTLKSHPKIARGDFRSGKFTPVTTTLPTREYTSHFINWYATFATISTSPLSYKEATLGNSGCLEVPGWERGFAVFVLREDGCEG